MMDSDIQEERPKLDCGSSACYFAKDKSGQRNNGPCRCLADLRDDQRFLVIRFIRALMQENEQLRLENKILDESDVCKCLYCGDDRSGKASLFVDGKAFCDELHHDRWVDSTDWL